MARRRRRAAPALDRVERDVVVIVTRGPERGGHIDPGTVRDQRESQDIPIKRRGTREVGYPKVHVADSDRGGKGLFSVHGVSCHRSGWRRE